jgi:anti-sigma factor RsiW
VTCRDFADFLMDYLDGSLSAPERECFKEHLAECSDCAAYLATYQETIRLGKAVCADDKGVIPPEVPDELVRAIVAARSAKRKQSRKQKPQSGAT